MTYKLPKTILERFLSKKFVILGRAGLSIKNIINDIFSGKAAIFESGGIMDYG